MVKVKKEVLEFVREDESIIYKIANETDKAFRTVERWITRNKPDGPLTKASALDVIRKCVPFESDDLLEPAETIKDRRGRRKVALVK